ncbi:MAG: MOSC domain-containing protein [Alphaproteobacteria bacterium]|nr:MOSC domain-containing protein [Alphaproteobacteria bacterium]
MTIKVASLFRYPIKGLSPEPMSQVQLEAGHYFPGDRIFAIENGRSGFDPLAPQFLPKTRFLMLMKHEQLAKLTTHYQDASGELTLSRQGEPEITFAVRTEAGRQALRDYLIAFFKPKISVDPEILAAPEGFRFTDSRRSGFVSLLNLNSVRDLSRLAGAEVDPLRFRANLHFDGLPAWQEMQWVGRSLHIGGAQLKILKAIDRCPATQVNPLTAQRDLDMVGLLEQNFGHNQCGVYAKIIQSGSISTQDRIELI